MKIAIIGPYPKPYGGISVHIRNFTLYYLKTHHDKLKINIYNTSNQKELVDDYDFIKRIPSSRLKINFILRPLGLIKPLIHFKPDIIHYSGSASWVMRIITLLFSKTLRAKSILSIHGAGFKNNIFGKNLVKTLSLTQKIIWVFIKNYNHIVCDNHYQIRNLKVLGYGDSKISLISEFIPPIMREEDYEKIPDYIQNFFTKNQINLYGMGWDANIDGVDLYGIDMMLKLMQQIKLRYNELKIGLTLKLLNVSDKYLEKLNKEITEKSLDNILIIERDIREVYPLIEKADIMIRPTCTDGDSVSIREALYFNTEVITSNAVSRPKGCIVFKNRDQDDFEKKAFSLIEKLVKHEKVKENIENKKNNAEKIINLYMNL